MFIYGLLTGVVLFAFTAGAIYIGYRMGRKPQAKPNKEQEKRAAELQESFVKLMNYDLETALRRRGDE